MTVVLGVTGSIAAYKAAELLSLLRKADMEVHVIMTKAACEFIAPLTFETLTGQPVVTDMFNRRAPWEVEHISLAKKADVFVIAPATANIIGKAANGIADDMLTATLLATRAPVIIAPAMNTGMYENQAVQHNIMKLRTRGVRFVEPAEGRLACGDTGRGHLAQIEAIAQAIMDASAPQDYLGRQVLVTAGPTQENLDPVRFLTNHSTGKMGYALAMRARARGAKVTLISGPVQLTPPEGIEMIPVVSAREMRDAVMARMDTQDFVIKAAAVGDYRPAQQAPDKLKKNEDDLTLRLVKNPDILAEIGQKKRANQTVCGFAMETRDLIENAHKKLCAKNCDLIVANNLKVAGAGFAHDTNVVTLLFRDGHTEAVELMRKDVLADLLLDRMLTLHEHRTNEHV